MERNDIHTICYIVAMAAEARPFIQEFRLGERTGYFAPLPCVLYEGKVHGKRLCLVLPGRSHGADLVGCEAASMVTTLAISRLKPDLIVNSGTCGGFISHGAEIGKVYVGNCAMFHDRRVPGDDAWQTQSLGNYPAWEGSQALAEELSLPMGKVTTGSSLDMQPCDLEIITAARGELKDMEGAAIGFVSSLYSVPVLYVKAVTDLCDGGETTYEEFSRNLAAASEQLRIANKRVIETLCGIMA